MVLVFDKIEQINFIDPMKVYVSEVAHCMEAINPLTKILQPMRKSYDHPQGKT
jgi:hypothetical protein